jgi:twitching motility protein PilT
MTDLEKRILSLLQTAVQTQSSDIHITTGQPPALRTSGELQEMDAPPFSAEEMNALCLFMISDPKVKAQYAELSDIDGSFEVRGLGRFRFNIYKSVHGRSLVLRVINSEVPTVEKLNLPKVLLKIAEANRGLVLVTGATGSGKTSTLAAMIDHLNSHHKLHILTIEDPVEFLHPKKASRVSQREVGKDTSTFAVALKSALRQDPDVILVGEMRDFETLDIALKAAETGHLVFSTVHTSDAMKTIGRLISLFPPSEQQSARVRLSDNLHAIISQRLVPTSSGGKVVAQEILINNAGIADCILNEKKTFEIPGFIEKGREVSGMQTFDQHLAELVQNQVITVETALSYASNPNDFQRNLAFGSASASLASGGDNQGLEMQGGGMPSEGLSLETESLPMSGSTAAPPKPLARPPGPPKPPKIPGAA